MDRVLVVVFDNDAKAYEGRKALLRLDAEGSIGLYAYAVVMKDANGKARSCDLLHLSLSELTIIC